MIRVSEIEPEEWAGLILDLDESCFPLDVRIKVDLYRWWLAFEGDIVVGYAAMRALPAEPDTAYLARAGIVETHRGRGLQRRLIHARVRAACRAGLKKVCTYTLRNNPASSNSLIRCGFQVYLPAGPWGGDGAIYWLRSF